MRKTKNKYKLKNLLHRKKNKELKELLKKTKDTNPSIDNVTLSSIEGLSIVNKFSLKFKLKLRGREAHVSAMSAAVFSVGERAIEEFNYGELKKVIIEGDKGKVIISRAGSNALLTVFTRSYLHPIGEKQMKLISISSLDGEQGEIFMKEYEEKKKVLFAIVAAILSVGGHSVYYVKKSKLKKVCLEGDKGNVIISPNEDKTSIETHI